MGKLNNRHQSSWALSVKPQRTITLTGLDGKKYVYRVPIKAQTKYGRSTVEYIWSDNGRKQKLVISLAGVVTYEVDEPAEG